MIVRGAREKISRARRAPARGRSARGGVSELAGGASPHGGGHGAPGDPAETGAEISAPTPRENPEGRAPAPGGRPAELPPLPPRNPHEELMYQILVPDPAPYMCNIIKLPSGGNSGI